LLIVRPPCQNEKISGQAGACGDEPGYARSEQELLSMAAPRTLPRQQAATDVARLLHQSSTAGGRLQLGVELAVSLIQGCDHASVTVLTPHYVETVAASDDVVRRGDGWQYELSEGPCLDSVRGRATVVSQDLGRDPRWRSWASRAVDGLGVHAMMSVLLHASGAEVGSLNLYADRVEVWDDEAQLLARSLADQLAVAVADARPLDQRERALLSRSGIGQAQGIVMERFGLSADQALDLLRRMSEGTRVGLVHLAEHIVESRRLPTSVDDLPGD
jgi:GAF domain-containing protein